MGPFCSVITGLVLLLLAAFLLVFDKDVEPQIHLNANALNVYLNKAVEATVHMSLCCLTRSCLAALMRDYTVLCKLTK